MNTSASDEPVGPRARLHYDATVIIELDPKNLRQISRLEQNTARHASESLFAPGSKSGHIKGGSKPAHTTIESEESLLQQPR